MHEKDWARNLLGGAMGFADDLLGNKHEGNCLIIDMPEKALIRSMIVRAIYDAAGRSKDGKPADAREFIFENRTEPDFSNIHWGLEQITSDPDAALQSIRAFCASSIIADLHKSATMRNTSFLAIRRRRCAA